MKRLPILTFIVACLSVLCWLNVSWLRAPLDISALAVDRVSEAIPAESDSPGSPSVFEGDSGSDISETLLRPVFHATRRPFTPPVIEDIPEPEDDLDELDPVAAPIDIEPPATPPEFRLAGVSLVNDRKRALLGSGENAAMRWYAEGDRIDGWSVVSVTSNDATLSDGDQSLTLRLYSAPLTRSHSE